MKDLKDIEYQTRDRKQKEGVFSRDLLHLLQKAAKRNIDGSEQSMYYGSVINLHSDILVGSIMDDTAARLKMVNEEVEESKKILQELYNEVRVVHDQVAPLLKQQIADLRTARMTAVQEIQATLTMMKDIRKFFLDSDHSEEINRLNNFVGLCNELKALKENGTIDAISDTILKLSIKK